MEIRSFCNGVSVFYRVRHTATVLLLTLMTACSQNAELPSMAIEDVSSLLPVVANQLETLRAQVDKSPKDADLNGQYALALATYGRDERANTAFQRARLLAPSDARWALYQSFVLRRLARTEEALLVADEGLSASPGQIDLMVRRAELLLDLGQFDEAETLLDAVLVENAAYPLAQFYKGRIHVQKGQWPLAVERFSKMLNDGIRANEVHFNLANAFRRVGQPEKAVKHLEISQSGGQTKIEGFDLIIREFNVLNLGDQPHVVRGATYYRNGNISKAIAEFEQAYQKNPDNIGTHVHLIRMYGHNRQLDKALEHYNKAVSMDPGFNQLESNLGFAYKVSGDYANAAEAYGKAVERKPNDATLQAELATSLDKSGHLEAAINHYEKSLELNPANRDLRHSLGDAFIAFGDFNKARDVLKSALKPEDQKTIVVLRSLAKSYVLSGDNTAAQESLGSALNIARKYDNQRLVDALTKQLDELKSSQSTG